MIASGSQGSQTAKQGMATRYTWLTMIYGMHWQACAPSTAPGEETPEGQMGLTDILPGSEPTATDEVCSLCPSLTYQQRLIGFVCCFAFGYLLSFIGTLSLISMTKAGIRNFAALYVLGNIIAICATGFLTGPKNQCKKMFDETRRWSTCFYMAMLIIVFAVAVSGQNVFLVLFLLLIQVLAAVWYTLSYIPFGRKAAVGCCQGTLFKPCPKAVEWLA